MTRGAIARGSTGAVLVLVLATAATGVSAEPPAAPETPPVVGAPAQAAPSAAGTRRRQTPSRRRRPTGGERIKALSRALGLDAAQEAEVKRALLAQHEEIQRLLSGPRDPDVPLTAALHAIADRTTERIRAVLNEEQRKRYIQVPQQRRDGPHGFGKPPGDEWTNAMQPNGKG